MKNKKLPIIIIVLCIFFFGIGYWVSDFKKDDPKKNDKDEKKQIFNEPSDLKGYWVSDKNQVFKITKKGSKYIVNIGYMYVTAFTYKNGKISDNDTAYTRLEKGTGDKFDGLWQGEKQLTGVIKTIRKILITKENGKYTCKYWNVNGELVKIDSDESIYFKAKDKLGFYSTYKSTEEYTWDKEDGSLKNTFGKYIYKKKNKDSIMLPTNTTTKRKEVETYDYFTRVR
jgi:hypothetical protein